MPKATHFKHFLEHIWNKTYAKLLFSLTKQKKFSLTQHKKNFSHTGSQHLTMSSYDVKYTFDCNV